MARVKELRARRATLVTQAKEILDKAQKESRELTSSEGERFDTTHSEIESLASQIDRAEKQERTELELSQSTGVRAGRQDTDHDDVGSPSSRVDDFDPESRVLSPKQSFAIATKAGTPRNGVTTRDFLRAAVLGPRNDAERRAMGEATGAGGGFTVPTPLAANFIDKLRAVAVIMRAGALTVPMDSQTLSLARLSGDAAGAWRSENAAVTANDAVLERVLFTAQSFSFLVKVSRELAADSPNVGAILENAFIQCVSREIDRVALAGTGTPPEPKGIKPTAGVGSVSMGVNGLAFANYDPFLDAAKVIAEANSNPATAAIMSPRSAIALAKLKDTTQQALRPPKAIENLPFLATTTVVNTDVQGSSGAVASRVYMGDFSQLMLGIREGIEIEILKERYSDNAQLAFFAHMRMDVQLAHPESFAQIIGIL